MTGRPSLLRITEQLTRYGLFEYSSQIRQEGNQQHRPHDHVGIQGPYKCALEGNERHRVPSDRSSEGNARHVNY